MNSLPSATNCFYRRDARQGDGRLDGPLREPCSVLLGSRQRCGRYSMEPIQCGSSARMFVFSSLMGHGEHPVRRVDGLLVGCGPFGGSMLAVAAGGGERRLWWRRQVARSARIHRGARAALVNALVETPTVRGSGLDERMTAYDVARRLPAIGDLRNLSRSLAVLDTILSPDWEYRYYPSTPPGPRVRRWLRCATDRGTSTPSSSRRQVPTCAGSITIRR